MKPAATNHFPKSPSTATAPGAISRLNGSAGSVAGNSPGFNPTTGAFVFGDEVASLGGIHYSWSDGGYEDGNGNFVGWNYINANFDQPNAAFTVNFTDPTAFGTDKNPYQYFSIRVNGKRWNSADGSVALQKLIDDALQGSGGSAGGGIDWGGVANAGILLVGGVAEMAVAGGVEYFTAGLVTPVSGIMMFDGSARVVANTQRLYLYFNHNTALANAFPTSLGGLAGKGVDMAFGTSANKIGYGQAIGSWGNDLGSFAMVGGNGLALFEFYESPSFSTGLKYGFSIFSYPYSLYNDKPNK